MNTFRSARSGIRSSFMISFRPSARVWSRPHGPALFGPTRFWKSEISFRSNQIMKMTEVSSRPKATTVLSRTISTSARPMPPLSSGSTPRIDNGSIRAAPPARR